MENLSRIAQSIFLGNGEVWNFLDYAVNRNCGGLMVYTQRMDFLGTNLINNFNGGFKRRYDGSDQTFTNGYAINRLTGGVMNAQRGLGEDIGGLYNVPDEYISSNSDYKFITEDEYTEFQKAIRTRNLSKRTADSSLINENEKQLYKDFTNESYAGQFEDKWKDVEIKEISLGDEIDLWKNESKHPKYSLEELGQKAKDVNGEYQRIIRTKIKNKNLFPGIYRDYSVYTVESYNGTDAVSLTENRYKVRKINEDNRIYKFLKPLISVAAEKRNKIGAYQNASKRFIDLASKKVVLKDGVTFGGLFKEYTTKDSKEAKQPLINNGGLYEFYQEIRNGYKSQFKGIKYPFNNEDFWFNGKSYGVEYGQKGEEYIYEGRPLFDGNVPISSKYNDGKHSVYDSINGVREYTLYEEGGVDNIGVSDYVSNGSSVATSSYENASFLLKRTNDLFKQSKINSLINRFHIKAEKDELTTAYDSTYGLSRGRNLLKKDENGNVVVDKSSGYDDPYCRVWTARHQYSKLKDRIRPFVDDKGMSKSIEDMQSNYGNLRPNDGAYRLSEHSVLRQDGFVRITPTHKDGKLYETPKNYMFSIENLAWRDITVDEQSTALSKEQRGPNGGRIMWFPPYNLKFSENINVNWNANTFIGRGEEIYTYTNTVRSGTLDFTLLIDHPSILNKWRGVDDVSGYEKENKEYDILRFFAGCGNLNDTTTAIENENNKEDFYETFSTNVEPTFYTKKIAYVMFFPNNFSAQDYMNGNMDAAIDTLNKYNKGETITESDKTYEEQILHPWNSGSTGEVFSSMTETIKKRIFGGDDNIDEIKFFNDLIAIDTNFDGTKIFGMEARNCEILNIELKGFASNHGKEEYNKDLCNRRRTFIEKLLQSKSSYFDTNNVTYVRKEGSIIPVLNIDGREDINSVDAKLARAAYVTVNIRWKEENVTHEGPINSSATTLYGANVDNVGKMNKIVETKTSNIKTETNVIESEYTYDNEYLYFSELRDDSLVHKHIVDKVRYFDPAFHSITPEGFNARLTFLHQCTRQGPTNAISSGHINSGSEDFFKFAGNLAFGRAPYCILRIGDFFNTKICIDSMSITYDNNGVQWDLNPEGVGVQPMYANISLSFKFLGGQDIVKPIERLQNAVTANYYANASIYSRHADNNKNYYDALEDSYRYRNKQD